MKDIIELYIKYGKIYGLLYINIQILVDHIHVYNIVEKYIKKGEKYG